MYKSFFILISLAVGLFLKLIAYELYDPNPLITPEEQDYIFNMVALAEFCMTIGFYYALLRAEFKRYGFLILIVARVILFSTAFASTKEIAGGLNITNTITETVLFYSMNGVVIAFTIFIGYGRRRKHRRGES